GRSKVCNLRLRNVRTIRSTNCKPASSGPHQILQACSPCTELAVLHESEPGTGRASSASQQSRQLSSGITDLQLKVVVGHYLTRNRSRRGELSFVLDGCEYRYSRGVGAPGDPVLLEVWRWLEAAELALDKPGKRDRSAVFQIAAGDLHADRQAVALRDRHRRRRQAGQDCDARPYTLVVVRDLRSIDLEIALVSRRMIMRECLSGHWRAPYDVDILEQRLPPRPHPAPGAALSNPLRMADSDTAQAPGCEALIIGRQGTGRRLDPCTDVGWQVRGEKRCQQPAVHPARQREVRQLRALAKHSTTRLAEPVSKVVQRCPDATRRRAKRMLIDHQHAIVSELFTARRRQRQFVAHTFHQLIRASDDRQLSR